MSADAFVPLTLDALFALDLPEPAWAVEEMLPLGSVTLFSAREKAGKGLLSIDLLASIASDEPFLDRAVRQGPVVYCAAEENVRLVRERIETRIGDRRDVPLLLLPLNGWTGDRLDLADPEGMQRLYNMVKAEQPVAVVLDTLRALHTGQEDKSDEMQPLIAPVGQIAHETNAAFVFNHHQNKLGGYRGSTAIRAACDQEWAFHREENAGDGADAVRGTIRVEGRHGPPFTLHVRLGVGGRWALTNAPPVLADQSVRGLVLAWLRDHPEGGESGRIAEGIGRKQKSVQNAVLEMRKESPPPIVATGSGFKGAARVYRAVAPRLVPDDAPYPSPDGSSLPIP